MIAHLFGMLRHRQFLHSYGKELCLSPDWVKTVTVASSTESIMDKGFHLFPVAFLPARIRKRDFYSVVLTFPLLDLPVP
jgi:hypothetical protein